MSGHLQPDSLQEFKGQIVVLDAASPYVFLGTLAGYDRNHLILENADAHDLRDTQTTRELYVRDSKEHGVHVNRRRVVVRCDEIVAVSLLQDVIE